MTEKCNRCGGELEPGDHVAVWHKCKTCGSFVDNFTLLEGYQHALGVAVKALSLIAGEQVYNKSDTAEAALKKIRGEE